MSFTRRLPRTAAAALVAFTAAAVLTACGGGGGEGVTAQPVADSNFNVADVNFAQLMLPHHLQAVKIASLAATRAKDPKVKKLAAAIVAGKAPEVEAMQMWLANWGAPLMAGMPGMDFTQMSPEQLAEIMPEALPRLASGGEIERLTAAKGARFDRLFLTLMLELHRGALAIAGSAQDAGSNPAATALASDIESAQKAELARIQKLLDA
ncbi:DUF305 domain-containing protein [Sporichthya sp.]|uniref:DUF305 domain-containing protein n=1 Tax=Sporichthya sp. TaxID=65475 RepID=UPI00184B4B87|nr:DUF305 domain-containing protein [Sporichthya sp.]MBA3741623.1 DUF305 domain-containing protein [Sporichthya sp.]